ncbi:MAG TPA: glutaredoxin domain-containing protein [Acidimicrobiales bacterium]|nr:glutaredoxin domain-containing protein [Acidimicrobiales bacterium]
MTLRVLGTSWCSDCTRSKALLDRHQIAYDWIDIETDEDAAREVEARNDGVRVVPTIVLEDGSVLVEPSDEELSAALGIA